MVVHLILLEDASGSPESNLLVYDDKYSQHLKYYSLLIIIAGNWLHRSLDITANTFAQTFVRALSRVLSLDDVPLKFG